jgi:hypothetical protein
MMNIAAIQLLIMLLLAHLLGDFILQPTALLKKKKQVLWNALHSLIQGALAYLLLASWNEWLVPVLVTTSHFLIDLGKQRLKRNSLAIFLIDQLLHLTIIALVTWLLLIPKGVSIWWFTFLPPVAVKVAACIAAIILLLPVGGIMIGLFVQPYQQQIKDHYQNEKKKPIEGLANGGKIIGWLERALIFIFVLAGQFAGIGFLVAAKSIFRFGEFKESENRKEAEYIIIGTFASFLYAILISLVLKWTLGSY